MEVQMDNATEWLCEPRVVGYAPWLSWGFSSSYQREVRTPDGRTREEAVSDVSVACGVCLDGPSTARTVYSLGPPSQYTCPESHTCACTTHRGCDDSAVPGICPTQADRCTAQHSQGAPELGFSCFACPQSLEGSLTCSIAALDDGSSPLSKPVIAVIVVLVQYAREAADCAVEAHAAARECCCCWSWPVASAM